MTDRARFMAAIHVALEHDQTRVPAEPAPSIDDALVRLARRNEDLLTIFTRRAEEVGMHVERVTAGVLVDRVLDRCKALKAKSVATSAGFEDEIARAGFALIEWRVRDGFDRMFDVTVGLTSVHAALAETGTLICESGLGFARSLSLVPHYHIAIVRKSDVLPDMIDYWARYQGATSEKMPSSIAMITGPSKTADIEGHLVQGVHGPREVFILLVEDA